MRQLQQVHGFNVSIYGIDRETGFNFLLGEELEPNYGKAIQAERRLKIEYPSDTKIVISEVIYLI